MIPISKPFLGEEEIKAVNEVLKSGIIAQGPKVDEAEKKFAKLCGTKSAIALNSGTASLHTALKVAGIKEGDEVITTPFTFIATANTILMQGAKPVFADVLEDTFNINPSEIKKKITHKTKAIVTVDLYGQLCDYQEIGDTTTQKNIVIIEDACQAINAEFNGKKAGSLGHIGAFSFYATKNITCGEGGMVTTNSEDYAEKAKLFRQHGRSDMKGYDYNDIGYNYRMTDMNAAILLEQMKKLELITKKRIENAAYLTKGLKGIKGIEVPFVKKGNKHVFHQYTIKVKRDFPLKRDELARHLKETGIGCNIYYPKALHMCEHLQKYEKGVLPVAEKLCNEVLSIPVHPHLIKEEMDQIIDAFENLNS